jgi:hypothetical protein
LPIPEVKGNSSGLDHRKIAIGKSKKLKVKRQKGNQQQVRWADNW